MLQDIPTPTRREAGSCVIETERLTLRRPTLADVKAIASLANDRRIAENTRRLPHVHSAADLDGLTVRRCDRGGLVAAVADLASGACDALIDLAPVLGELVRDVPDVEVVARGLSVDEIAIAVAGEDTALLARLQVGQAELEEDGTLQRLRRKWLGNPFVDQAAAVH